MNIDDYIHIDSIQEVVCLQCEGTVLEAVERNYPIDDRMFVFCCLNCVVGFAKEVAGNE